MSRFALPFLLFFLLVSWIIFHIQFMRTDFHILVKQCSPDTKITRDEGPLARSGYMLEVWEHGSYSVRITSNSLDEVLGFCTEKK